VGRTHAGAGEQHEEEGAAETKHYKPTTICFPYSLAPLRGQEVEESRVKLSLGRRRVGGKSFKFSFYFSLSYFIINWQ